MEKKTNINYGHINTEGNVIIFLEGEKEQ